MTKSFAFLLDSKDYTMVRNAILVLNAVRYFWSFRRPLGS